MVHRTQLGISIGAGVFPRSDLQLLVEKVEKHKRICQQNQYLTLSSSAPRLKLNLVR